MASTPTQKQKLRRSISADCAGAVRNERRIHYDQHRPFRYYDHLDAVFATLDCSGFVDNIFWNAMHDNGIWLHDPLDERWSGFGNTATMEAYLRAHGKPVTTQGYMVGDIARYGTGNHAHTTICSKAGTAKTSEWTSHGTEAGPKVVRLGYRNDLIGVWRIPELL